MEGHADLVQAFVSAGADVNLQRDYGVLHLMNMFIRQNDRDTGKKRTQETHRNHNTKTT